MISPFLSTKPYRAKGRNTAPLCRRNASEKCHVYSMEKARRNFNASDAVFQTLMLNFAKVGEAAAPSAPAVSRP